MSSACAETFGCSATVYVMSSVTLMARGTAVGVGGVTLGVAGGVGGGAAAQAASSRTAESNPHHPRQVRGAGGPPPCRGREKEIRGAWVCALHRPVHHPP